MANASIYAAFERMWQHIVAKIGTKADIDHSHGDIYDAKGSAENSLESAKAYTDTLVDDIVIPTKVSELTNDKGYLTEHQSLEGLATQNYVDEATANLVSKDDIPQFDWNQNNETELDYIKNRTHWSEPEYETIVPLQTTTGQHPIIELDSLPYGGEFDFPEDAVFVIDGISYEVSSWYNDGEKFYGDSRLGVWEEGAYINQNSHPEDVPFCAVFTWYDEDFSAGGGFWGNSVYQLHIDFPEDREHTVEVKKRVGTVYHKLDINYLPIDDIYNSVMDKMPIAEEATF